MSSSHKTMSGFSVLDAEGFLKHVRHLDKPLFISYGHNSIHQTIIPDLLHSTNDPVSVQNTSEQPIHVSGEIIQ